MSTSGNIFDYLTDASQASQTATRLPVTLQCGTDRADKMFQCCSTSFSLTQHGAEVTRYLLHKTVFMELETGSRENSMTEHK